MNEISEFTQWFKLEYAQNVLETNVSLAAVSELLSGAWVDLAALEECEHWFQESEENEQN